MSTQAKLGKGTILQVGDASSPTNFSSIPEVVEISGTPGGTPDEVSVFNHDSPTMWDETLTAIIRAKTITVRANWQKAGASANSVVLGLQTIMEAGTSKYFRITLPTTAAETVTFQALVTEWQVTTPVAGAMEVQFSLKNTGSPVWA